MNFKMKKIVTLTLVLCMLLGVYAPSASAMETTPSPNTAVEITSSTACDFSEECIPCYSAAENDILRCDLNGDGLVTAADINLLIYVFKNGKYPCDEYGHTYKKVIVSPTCEEVGIEAVVCTTCGDSFSIETPALGHTEVISPAVPATCTQTGLTEGKHCDVCGEVILAQAVVPALGHTEVISPAVPATCTQTGLTEGKYCGTCGKVFTVKTVVEALGHTEVVDAAIPVTCTQTGLTEGAHCDTCGEIFVVQKVVPALGHTEVTDIAIPASCTETGLTEGKHCATCGEVLVAQEVILTLAHSYETITTTPPTCEKTGEKTFVCTVCGGIYTEEIPALGHSYEVSVTAPTAKEDGCATYTCACGDIYTEAIVPQSFTVTSSNRTNIGYTGKEGEILVIPAVFKKGSVWYRVTKIDGSAFRERYGLANVVIPDSVTSIGDYAFYSCSKLTSVVIPDSVTSIGSYAFQYCYKLVEVINKSSLSITAGSSNNGYVAYYAKEVHTGESKIVNQNGYLFYTYNGVNYLLGYVGDDTSLTLPESDNGQSYEIYNYAFYSCSNLTSVVIPDSVTSIGEYAFSYCSNLTNITLPDSLTSIGEYAFFSCSSLASIIIPNNVTRIGKYAFRDCRSLTSITLPDSLTSIGAESFFYCYKLVEVINKSSLSITAGSSNYGSIAYYAKEVHTGESKIVNQNGYLFYTYNGVNYLLGYVGTKTALTLPASYNGQSYEIYDWAFSYRSDLTSVIISDSVTHIGFKAFYNCSNLTSVTIDSGVTSIGSSAFSYCSNLTSVTIGSGVTSIGSSAFSYCSNLTSVTIGSGVTSIGSSAFSHCSSLTSVTIGDGVTSIDRSVFSHCSSLTSVTIGNGVTSIGSSVFSGCSALTSIVFKDTTTWYRTTSYTDWNNKENGTNTSVTNASTNATYFRSTYSTYYWYKK